MKFRFFIVLSLILAFLLTTGFVLTTYYIPEEPKQIIETEPYTSNPSFYTFEIEEQTPLTELQLIREKTREIRKARMLKEIENEEKEKEFEEQFDDFKTFFDRHTVYGFDEELYGSKNLYLNWKTADDDWFC